MEENTVMVEEREREIRQIVQSISDLNEIFRDLAGMVVEQVAGRNAKMSTRPCLSFLVLCCTETCLSALMCFCFLQGTVLDRIDFNVEQACVKTDDGLKQLQKVNVNSPTCEGSLHSIHFQNEVYEFSQNICFLMEHKCRSNIEELLLRRARLSLLVFKEWKTLLWLSVRFHLETWSRDMAEVYCSWTHLTRVCPRVDMRAPCVDSSTDWFVPLSLQAEQYQKKNRKMLVILILFVVVLVLIIILFGTKF